MTSQPPGTRETGAAPAAESAHGPLPPLLLLLTVVTGVVDAVSILRLGRVFVANMTGNVVFTGFALVGAPGFALSASLAALAGFLAGALLGGMATSRLGHDRALLLRAGAAAELVLVAAALVLTMTLTGIAADLRASDHGLGGLGRRVLAVLAMLAGGAVGALLVLHASTAAALGLAAGTLAVVTAGAVLAARKPGKWREGKK